jgi:hypothetical protein
VTTIHSRRGMTNSEEEVCLGVVGGAGVMRIYICICWFICLFEWLLHVSSKKKEEGNHLS